MQVGETTDKRHVQNLLAKLDAGKRKEVVVRARILDADPAERLSRRLPRSWLASRRGVKPPPPARRGPQGTPKPILQSSRSPRRPPLSPTEPADGTGPHKGDKP